MAPSTINRREVNISKEKVGEDEKKVDRRGKKQKKKKKRKRKRKDHGNQLNVRRGSPMEAGS